MKNCILPIIVVFSALFIFSACTEEPEQNKEGFSISIKDEKGESVNITINGKEDLKNAMKDLENSLGELGEELKEIDLNFKDEDGKKMKTVRGSELKKILPKRIAGIERKSSESSTNGIFGFKVTNAKAEYQEDDESINVEIVDVGGVGKMANKMADWTDLEVDKEESDGSFERTTTIGGHPALEKYVAKRNKYEVAAFVNSHFVVKIEGQNVKLKKLKYVVEDIIDDLEDF